MKSRAVDYLLDKLAARRRFRSFVRRGSRRVSPRVPLETLLPPQDMAAIGADKPGAVSVSPERFAALLSPSSRATLARLVEECASGWCWNNDRMNSEAVLAFDPAIYRLGFDENLLAMAETYLGQPCLFLGPLLKREVGDGSDAATRRWHTDVEDECVFRVLIYLSAVDENNGPFEYISLPATDEMKRATGYRSGYVRDSDPRYRSFVQEKVTCCGPVGTAIIFDGARVLHRVKPPVQSERLSLTLTYTSRHPLQIFRETRMRSASRARLRAQLASSDMRRIPAARWL